MPDKAGSPEGRPADRNRRAETRRHNEHLKLAASALDRISTVVMGGAVLAPIFQHTPPRWFETAGWVVIALFLHATAHYVTSRLIEET